MYITSDFQFELLAEQGMPGDDDLADVAAWVSLHGVVNLERHVEGRHLLGKTDTLPKMVDAEGDGVLSVGDDLDRKPSSESHNQRQNQQVRKQERKV